MTNVIENKSVMACNVIRSALVECDGQTKLGLDALKAAEVLVPELKRALKTRKDTTAFFDKYFKDYAFMTSAKTGKTIIDSPKAQNIKHIIFGADLLKKKGTKADLKETIKNGSVDKIRTRLADNFSFYVDFEAWELKAKSATEKAPAGKTKQTADKKEVKEVTKAEALREVLSVKVAIEVLIDCAKNEGVNKAALLTLINKQLAAEGLK